MHSGLELSSQVSSQVRLMSRSGSKGQEPAKGEEKRETATHTGTGLVLHVSAPGEARYRPVTRFHQGTSSHAAKSLG